VSRTQKSDLKEGKMEKNEEASYNLVFQQYVKITNFFAGLRNEQFKPAEG